MYIQPNTNIRFLKNCPLDNTYDHTIYFASVTEQTDYFIGLTKYFYNDLTYIRLNKGTLKIQRKSEDLYDCNYLMYQNTSFGNKWFYAFITSVEYVNNNTSLVTFEIDDMQTWFFDVTLEQCFVEREHSTTDTIGSNLQPEPVSLGELTTNGYSTSGKMETPNVILCTNVGLDGQAVYGGMGGGVYNGCEFLSTTGVSDNAIKEIQQYIDSYDTFEKLNQSITACFMYDRAFSDTAQGGLSKNNPATYTISKSKNYDNLDGYVPRNNKLFTYPYNYMLVTTDSGDSIELKYEFFSGSNCQFTMQGSLSANPQILLDPLNYMGCSRYRNARLVLSGFPQCSFNIDSFKAWLSQTASNPSNITNTLSGVANSAVTGGAVGGAAAGLTAAAGYGVAGLMAANRPPEVKGTTQTDVAYASHTKDFNFFSVCLQADYAKRIDDFFDVYGYATNMHKVPNRNYRAHWNYVKNRTTNLIGNAPADSVANIIRIYNQGITFWKNGNEVGNYSLDNSI